MRKRTEITIEKHRLLMVRRRGESIRMRCAECGEQALMITPNQAAAIAGVSSRTIYSWIESAKVHFIEEPGGRLFVCANSLGAKTE